MTNGEKVRQIINTCKRFLTGLNKRWTVTNGDKIRAMTDEELTRKVILGNLPVCDDNCPNYVLCGTEECADRIKDWLKQEAPKDKK